MERRLSGVVSQNGSKRDHWSSPRPYTDELLRRKKHGPIRPMEYDEPGAGERFVRLFFRR